MFGTALEQLLVSGTTPFNGLYTIHVIGNTANYKRLHKAGAETAIMHYESGKWILDIQGWEAETTHLNPCDANWQIIRPNKCKDSTFTITVSGFVTFVLRS